MKSGLDSSFEVVEKCLRQIFGDLSEVSRVSPRMVPKRTELTFRTLAGRRGGIRWIVPHDSNLSNSILATWRPYGVASTWAWHLLRTLLKTPFWPLATNSAVYTCRPAGTSSLKFLQDDVEELSDVVYPVIYVGSPGERRKAVCFLVRNSGRCVGVAKVPLELGAAAAIIHETEILELLRPVAGNLIPRVMGRNVLSGCSIQTVLDGRPSGKHLRKPHLEFLLRLRQSGTISLSEWSSSKLPALVQLNWLSDSEQLKIADMLGSMDLDMPLPAVWRHGDFAPWNIRLRPSDGICQVYDWEHGAARGLPLLDAIHFIAIRGFLLGDSGRLEHEALQNAVLLDYARALGLSPQVAEMLWHAYCLEVISEQSFGDGTSYGRYLLSQVSRPHSRGV